MENYLLTIKIPMNATDSIDARLQIIKMMELMPELILVEKEVKLQKVFINKPPEGVKL